MSGEHYVTSHNMGMSFFYIGKMQEAKECFERSLQLNEVGLNGSDGRRVSMLLESIIVLLRFKSLIPNLYWILCVDEFILNLMYK